MPSQPSKESNIFEIRNRKEPRALTKGEQDETTKQLTPKNVSWEIRSVFKGRVRKRGSE